jgi:hypothetical protein
VLATHAFEHGGRLSARMAVDRATPGTVSTLRLGYRVPLFSRKFTLLLDDTLRHEDGRALNSFSAGGSFRVRKSSFMTVRATVADAEPNSFDVTWYRRF